MYSYFGEFCDINSVINLKRFFSFIGISINLIEDFFFNIDLRENFICNFEINENTILILVNLNLRYEMPLLNSKISKIIKKQNLLVFNFFNNNLGIFVSNSLFDFKNFIISKNKFNLSLFYNKFIYSIFLFNKNLLSLNFLLGLNFMKFFFNGFKSLLNNLFNNYVNSLIINVLVTNLAFINFFEIGLKFGKNTKYTLEESFIFLYNIDNEIFLKRFLINNYIVYVGSFFDIGAQNSNLVLPINLFFECNGLFINFEGNLRKLVKVINNNIYNSVELFKLLFIYFKLRISKFLPILEKFFKISKFFKKFFIN